VARAWVTESTEYTYTVLYDTVSITNHGYGCGEWNGSVEVDALDWTGLDSYEYDTVTCAVLVLIDSEQWGGWELRRRRRLRLRLLEPLSISRSLSW
jgi:hypothetical protein